MAKRIYGFIVDEALQKWSSNALLVSMDTTVDGTRKLHA